MAQFKKDVDMTNGIAALSPEDIDILMKYVYAGLSSPENSDVLLKWHAVLVNRGGLGSVTRVLTDKVNTL